MKTTKYCPRCQTTKPIDEFQKAKSRGDGHDAYCRLCRNEWKREKRKTAKYKEAARLYNYTPQRQAWYAEYSQRPEVKEAKKELARKLRREKAELQQATDLRYRRNHPERYCARYAVNNAVADGRLPKASSLPCALADEHCKGVMEYHHHKGYAIENALDVLPVCNFHHRQLDRVAHNPKQVLLDVR